VVYLYNKRQQNKLIRELEIKNKLEQERIRISRDLHDNVGAQLSYLITNIDWMLRHPEQITKDEENKRLQSLSEAGRNAILTLRQTIWAVGSNSLSVDDFADRFKQFALKMLEFDKTIKVTFDEAIEVNNMLSPSVALNLFRICQEAFNNCLKHAACSQISVSFKSNENNAFTLVITDNGKGFDLQSGSKNNHYGLLNMQARAQECGATLTINSTVGQGTTLTLVLN
jgi:signal transduction histidine kinase